MVQMSPEQLAPTQLLEVGASKRNSAAGAAGCVTGRVRCRSVTSTAGGRRRRTPRRDSRYCAHRRLELYEELGMHA